MASLHAALVASTEVESIPEPENDLCCALERVSRETAALSNAIHGGISRGGDDYRANRTMLLRIRRIAADILAMSDDYARQRKL
jgi:hypothetical protein